MARQIRSPEQVLEELYETGRRWMNARARERAWGPHAEPDTDSPSAEPRVTEGQDRRAREEHALRERFRTLAEEFMDRVDEP